MKLQHAPKDCSSKFNVQVLETSFSSRLQLASILQLQPTIDNGVFPVSDACGGKELGVKDSKKNG